MKGKKEEKKSKTKYKTVWACDFCDREFDSKEKSDSHEIRCYQNPKNQKFPFNNRLRRAWFWVWISTMVVFGMTLFISSKTFLSGIILVSKDSLSFLFYGNIGLGVIAFLAWLIPWRKPKNGQVSFLTKNIFIICLVYLLANPIIFAAEGYKAENNPDYKEKYFSSPKPTVAPIQAQPTPTITPIPTKQAKKTTSGTTNNTKTNTIDCIGPDGVHFQTTQVECDNFNKAWGNSSGTTATNKTGNLIKGYYSYCYQKKIDVYESELVWYTRKDGKQIWSTKEDIACYERDTQQNNNSTGGNYTGGNTTSNYSTQNTNTPSQPTAIPTSSYNSNQAAIDEYNRQVTTCRDKVRNKYDLLVAQCYYQSGGQSAGECDSQYKSSRSQENASCGQLIN